MSGKGQGSSGGAEGDAHEALEQLLGHRFGDRQLLIRALTHRSYANEHGGDLLDNERLEFLGDAVVGLAVGGELMRRYPERREGELSVLRAQLVSESGLARAARRIDLGRFLRLGRGEEQTGGRDKPSLLSDAFEALCAAIFLDAGFDAAALRVLELLAEGLAELDSGVSRDYKTRLQEVVQARAGQSPVYRLVGESGPDHDKRFTASVSFEGGERGRATGRSKKLAEQEAARIALDGLNGDG